MEHLNRGETVLCELLSAALHAPPSCAHSPSLRCGNDNMQTVSGASYTQEELELAVGIAEKHSVLPLLYDVLDSDRALGKNARERLVKKSRQTVFQSYRLLMLARDLVQLLKEHGIQSVLLKGSGTAGLYPVPELRKSGDIDLLLEGKEDAGRAYSLLLEKGFCRGTEHSQHHLVCVSAEGIEIELHALLAEPFDNVGMNRYLCRLQSEYFRQREEREVMGVVFPVPKPPYHAYYLLLHMLQHFLRAGFGVKLLCDWVVFWERESGADCKNTFLDLVRESKTEGFAKMITAVCVRYLGLSAERVDFLVGPEEIGAQAVEEMMAEILEAEEFGRSASDRMVVMRGTGLSDYIREFHHQTVLTYPGAGKYPILWPVLWLSMLAGFLYRNRKLRGVSSAAVLKKAGLRSRLAKQMHLFEK